ncbi:MAG TPA: hypothetical protein P5572_17055 [Phycisphaerae bacterium]|mgnify:CR=1 FL=1|nr:hypothetical protein [Phycisphaerales bacterium]HRX86736.1 hypothetical protein [Phycisphaerae bacterium]
MKKGVGLLAALAALVYLAPVTLAQSEDPPVDPQPAAGAPADGAVVDGAAVDAPAAPGVDRDRGPGSRVRRGRPNRNRNAVLLDAFREEVKRVLQADEETNGYIDDIFAEQLDALQQEAGDVAEQRREQANEMRDLVGELRDAQRDGDTDRIEKLREQITNLRRDVSSEQTVDLVKLEADMREVLDDAQFERYLSIQKKYEPRFTRSKDPNQAALQRVRRALVGVDLSPEQRDRIRELFTETAQTLRRVSNDKDRAAQVVDDMIDSVFDQLDDNQADAFDRKLTELEQQENAGRKDRRVGQPVAVEPGVADPGAPAPADDEQSAEQAAEQGVDDGGALPPE